jgi:hypothetical protein
MDVAHTWVEMLSPSILSMEWITLYLPVSKGGPNLLGHILLLIVCVITPCTQGAVSGGDDDVIMRPYQGLR